MAGVRVTLSVGGVVGDPIMLLKATVQHVVLGGVGGYVGIVGRIRRLTGLG
jgi:hypothetical protein